MFAVVGSVVALSMLIPVLGFLGAVALIRKFVSR
jgi:hypothetical protein